MDYPEFYREVSGSAGIAYGLMRSIEMGLLPTSERATAIIERVLAAVLPHIGEDGVVEGVSGGTPVMPSIQAYQDEIATYPTLYGQGLVLMLLAEALREEK